MLYRPYGKVAVAGDDDFRSKFNGHEQDRSGLQYFQARYYDPDIGRFVQADPTVPDPSKSQLFNRYMFVAGNPISFVDMEGYRPASGGVAGMPGQITEQVNVQQRRAEIRSVTDTEVGEAAYSITSVVTSNDDIAGRHGMIGKAIHEHVAPDGTYTKAENPVFWGREGEGQYDQPTSEDTGEVVYAPNTGDFDHDVVFDDPNSETGVSLHEAGYPTENSPNSHSQGCPTFGFENRDQKSRDMLTTIKNEARNEITVRMAHTKIDKRNPAEKARRPITKDKTITTEVNQPYQPPLAPASSDSWGQEQSTSTTPTEGDGSEE